MLFRLDSIRTRIILVLFGVLAGALVLGVLFLRPVINRHFVDMAHSHMSETTIHLAHDLEYFLSRARMELESVASMREMASLNRNAIELALLERSHTNTYFTLMCVADNHGVVVASQAPALMPGKSVPEARMPYIRSVISTGMPAYMDLIETRHGTLSSGIAVPIRDMSGASAGVLMGIMEATDGNFLSTMLKGLSLTGGESAYITGSDGRLLAHSSFPLSPAGINEYDFSDAAPVQAALSGLASFEEYAHRGSSYYASYVPIKGSGWTLVVQQEAALVDAMADRAMLIAAALLGGMFALIAMVQGLMINVAMRPLALLAWSLRNKSPLSASQLSSAKGEIAEMSIEISGLIENIRHRDELLEQINRDLDSRVQERTKELKEANARLSEEIAERRLTEERLMDARRRFEDVASNTGDWIWEIDGKGAFVFSSSGIERIIGTRAEDMIGRGFHEVFVPNASPDVHNSVLAEFFSMKPFKNVVRSVMGRDGMVRLIETSGVPIFDSSGEFRGYRGSARDVTERVLMDAKIKDSLREKEVLLKEIHHRVKNNMQVISSLLNLQARYVTDADTQGLFQESQNRLKAMALVHEKLYQSESLSQVNLSEYVRNLTAHLQKSMGGGRISLEVLLEEGMQLDIDTIIPCGLIINELVSNSIKHAFRNRASGNVTVKVAMAAGEYVIQVCDDGHGLPEGFDMQQGSSLGTKLVSALVAQIGGTIKAESSSEGTCFNLSFRSAAAGASSLEPKQG